LGGSEELAYNVFRLAEGGEILAQMFNLVQMFFRIPMLNLAPLPHFWQTDVGGWPFLVS